MRHGLDKLSVHSSDIYSCQNEEETFGQVEFWRRRMQFYKIAGGFKYTYTSSYEQKLEMNGVMCKQVMDGIGVM